VKRNRKTYCSYKHLIEAHHSIGKVERYHSLLRRAYDIIWKEPRAEKLSKEIVLQMDVKAINDTAGPNGLVPTLLVYGAYPRLTYTDRPAKTITDRSRAVRTAMAELRKIQAQRKLAEAQHTRNGPNVSETIRLPIDSDVKVWREKGGWSGPFKLISVDGKRCIVDTTSGPKQFRTNVVKPYYSEDLVTEIPITYEATPSSDRISGEPAVVITPKRIGQGELTPYEVPDEDDEAFGTFITRKEQADLELAKQLRHTDQ